MAVHGAGRAGCAGEVTAVYRMPNIRRSLTLRLALGRASAGALALLVAGLLTALPAPPATAGGPRALLVGSYHGVRGSYETIQAAVEAARPGDWILIGPGDYRTPGDTAAAVWITTPGIHLRGMDRNAVVVDGTRPGSEPACDPSPGSQT